MCPNGPFVAVDEGKRKEKTWIEGEKRRERKKAGLLGFEPRSEAPEATVLSRLYHRPCENRGAGRVYS